MQSPIGPQTPPRREPGVAGHRAPADVVVIVDRDRSQAIVQVLRAAGAPGPVCVEPDPLMALGRVARDRPKVVIATRTALGDQADTTAAALRKIVPAARLVLVEDSNDEETHAGIGQATDARQAGFDHRLTGPLDAATLRRALDLTPRSTPPPEAPAPPERTLELPPQGPSPRDSLTMPDLPRDLDVAWADHGDASQPLGDVDLIEQIVREPAHLPMLAAKLIAQQSGIASVGFARSMDHGPRDHVYAQVTRGDRSLGYLHAPAPATAQTLAPWADWLGHWLGLQQHVADLWQLALRDELTGVWNRRYFHRFLTKVLKRAAVERFRVTLLVFDIDDFKVYNDRYGHAAGDEILRETARLMQSVVRDHDVVARIGGDEFAVIFWDADAPRQPNSQHPFNVRKATQRFQQALCSHKFPKLLEQAHDTLTISAGLAGFPWDGRSPEELLEKADEMALCSKRQGKDAVTFGPGAAETCALYEEAQGGEQ